MECDVSQSPLQANKRPKLAESLSCDSSKDNFYVTVHGLTSPMRSYSVTCIHNLITSAIGDYEEIRVLRSEGIVSFGLKNL